MPLVHLIRHGKPLSGWGDKGADPDPGLDAEGWAQAMAAADSLMALPEHARPTGVASSPLQRCRDTAQPFAERLGLVPIIEPAVAEIPTPSDLAASERPAWLRRAFEGRWDEIVGDRDYGQWAQGVAAAAAARPGVAIFSHFVAINAAVSVAKGDPRVRQFEPGHCSITTFEIVDGRLVLVETGVSTQTSIL